MTKDEKVKLIEELLERHQRKEVQAFNTVCICGWATSTVDYGEGAMNKHLAEVIAQNAVDR